MLIGFFYININETILNLGVWISAQAEMENFELRSEYKKIKSNTFYMIENFVSIRTGSDKCPIG